MRGSIQMIDVLRATFAARNSFTGPVAGITSELNTLARKSKLWTFLVNPWIIFNVHFSISSYECLICGVRFAHSSNLYRHVRRHRNELPHCCSKCSKGFLTKQELTYHQIVHTKEKKEICEICQKCFGTQKNLKAHMKIHSGEKNYVCSVCDKRFTQPHVLRTHLKTHPGIEMPERGVILSQKALLRRLENVPSVSVDEN